MGKLKINGDLLLTGSISFQTSNYITPAFSASADSNGYGQNLLIGAGGNTVIGGGEGAQEFFTAAGVKDGENIYLAATHIHMYTDCNDIAKRKLVMSLNADGTISLPNSKKIDTDGTFNGSAAGIYRMNHFTTEEQVDSFQAPNTLQYCTIGAEYTPIGNDGILISAGWSSGRYGAQIWIDDGGGSGGMKIRSFGAGNGAKWNEWQTILTSLNYNDYTVTKTGSGASGTWGINITGNAATASLLSIHNTVTNTSTRSVSASSWTGSVSGLKYVWGEAFKDTSLGSDTGDLVLGLRAGQYTSGGTELCMMIDGDYYSMGNKVLHAGNYNSYAPTKTGSGASGTWGINITGNAATASKCNGVIPEWAGSIAWADTGWIAAWSSDGTKIKALNKSSFAPASHTHSYLSLSGGTMTGTITTPGNDSVVIKPAKNNYDQVGGSDAKFWKMFATYGFFDTVVTTQYGSDAPTRTDLPSGSIYFQTIN